LLRRGDFQLRIAHSPDLRGVSTSLVDRMYAWRGYKNAESRQFARRGEATLHACHAAKVFGTLTVRFDVGAGLAADASYREEIDAYRGNSSGIAELTRLAVDPDYGSKEVLGSLFHAAYALCGPARGVSHVFIEVNPRHVAFYKRMLHFQVAGELKTCTRVNAPAVLMQVGVAHVGQQATLYGGASAHAQRSLYPFFCAGSEAEELLRNVLRSDGRETTLRQTMPALAAG
jgi:hypothetical protein